MNTITKAKHMNINIDWAIERRTRYLKHQIYTLADEIEHLDTLQQQTTHRAALSIIQDRIDDAREKQIRHADEITRLKTYKPSEDIDLEEIRGKVKITDFVSVEYQRGDQAMCFSPLRDDGRHPSFSVNTEQNVWFDFALGEGGDVFDLYMRMNNCDFAKALKELYKLI
jgi:hypothetical protein